MERERDYDYNVQAVIVHQESFPAMEIAGQLTPLMVK